MAIVWDKALYDEAYESHSGKHFDRSALFPVFEKRAARLIEVLGLEATHRVVIFGCGFDWTGEALRAAGIDSVGSDTSPWIQGAHGTDVEWSSDKKPLNEGGAGNGSRQAIRREFVGNNDPTHVLSEDILTSLSDAEIAALTEWDGFTGAVVAHIVTPLEPSYAAQVQAERPLWNWKTRDDWRVFFNSIGLSHHRLFEPSDGLGEF